MNFKGFLSLCFVIVLFKSVSTKIIDKYLGNECSTIDNEPGICKKIPMCMEYFKKMFVRKDNSLVMCKTNSAGVDDLVICCKNEIEPIKATNFFVTPEVIVTTEPILNSRLKLSRSELACKEYRRMYETYENPAKKICLGNNVIGGDSSKLNEFPHMVAIGYLKDVNYIEYEFLCGGTLISDRYVLSAAHCVSKRSQVPQIARLGKTSIDTIDCNEAVDIEIDFDYTTQVHADYDDRSKHNDIALLKLHDSVEEYFSRVIQPACLHHGSKILNDVVVTGWGVIEKNSKQRSNWLQKVTLKEMTIENCRARYGNIRITIADSQICAANAGDGDACQGDSGGPLQYKYNNTYYVAGIVSFGAFCGTQLPGIYVRVNSYIDWIENIVWPN